MLFGLNAGWSPKAGRSTLQAFFLGINVVALATLGLPDRLPALVVVGHGCWTDHRRRIADRVPADAVRRATLVVAAAGSLLAIARGIAG